MKRFDFGSVSFLLVMAAALAAPAEVTSLKLDSSGKVLINDQPAKLWGLRVVCAAASDEGTKQLIDSLKGYQEAGVNLLVVGLQGGPGQTCRTFSADGKQIEDTAVRDRLRRIFDEAAKHDMSVVVSLFFPRRGGTAGQEPRLATREAYLAACATAARELKDRKNVMVCVADQPFASSFSTCPMKFTPVDVVECCRAIAAIAPSLPRGGGTAVRDYNVTVAKADAATVIFHCEANGAPPAFSVTKPIIHTGFAVTEAGRNPQGYYLPRERDAYTALIDRYTDASTAYFVAHFPAWTEGGANLKQNRFDPGGQGSEKDPGLMWYLSALEHRTRHASQAAARTPPAGEKSGPSIFDAPQPQK